MSKPLQTTLNFPDEDVPEPVCCPACGDERPRFKGRKNRADVYVCTQGGCGLLWESLRPGGKGGAFSRRPRCPAILTLPWHCTPQGSGRWRLTRKGISSNTRADARR